MRELHPVRRSTSNLLSFMRKPSGVIGFLLLLTGSIAEGQSTLTWGLDLSLENDDNITYGDGIAQEIIDDTVYRVVPRIAWEHVLEDHFFSLDLDAIFRRGTDTELSDQNIRGSFLVDLNFSGGLGLEVYDHYLNAEFDQQIFAPEAGVTTTDANLFGTELSYQPKDRLLFLVGYELTTEDYGEVVGARDIDRASARAEVPVAGSIAVYGDLRYIEQTSSDQPSRDYDDTRWVGGVLWKREGSRFSAWLEAGNQKIVFEALRWPDLEEKVFEIGTEVEISQSTTFSISGGRDGYDNPVANMVFIYEEPDDLTMAISLVKETRHLFVQSTLANSSPVFESTVSSLELTKHFLDRFRLGLRGSYIVFDTVERVDDTWSARLRFEYAMREWLRLGAHYEYASRSSDDPRFDFDVNRVGVFLVLTHSHG